jgi:ABC-type uncharacterized transport system permease subunit
MSIQAIALTTLILYLVGATLQSISLINNTRHLKKWVLGIGFVAICLHAILLHVWIDMYVGQNLNFYNLFSLTAWLIALIVWVVAQRKLIESLFIFSFPVCALSIALVLWFPTQKVINTIAQPITLFHILLAVICYCVLCFAGLLAVLLAVQEWCLRRKKMLRVMSSLPALETMEILLFQVIQLGFVLLSIVLVTSFYFYYAILFTQYYFLQKALLVTLAWLMFAWLLLGRYHRGWRGRKAIYGTLLGVFLLFLSYFGSQFLMSGMQ